MGEASLKSTMMKNSVIVTADSTSKKLSNSKYNPNGSNTNLYSMIYQNRSKNLVSNYLRGIDTQTKVQSNNPPQASKIARGGTSRN